MTPARWYVPPGEPLPAHLPPALPQIRHHDGVAGLPGGGLAIGGPIIDPAIYTALDEGYALGPAPAAYGSLRRSDAPPGAPLLLCSGLVLQVPRLIDPDLSYHAEMVHRHAERCAGQLRVVHVIAHQATADRLAALLRAIMDGDDTDLDDARLWQLALDIVCLGYHLSSAELIAWRTLHDDDPVRICMAAAGIDPTTEHDEDTD